METAAPQALLCTEHDTDGTPPRSPLPVQQRAPPVGNITTPHATTSSSLVRLSSDRISLKTSPSAYAKQQPQLVTARSKTSQSVVRSGKSSYPTPLPHKGGDTSSRNPLDPL
eukprot:9147758-Pyramimonas_sp.AAC.1